MDLSDRVSGSEAAATGVLGLANAGYFARRLAWPDTAPRRVAAGTLVLLNLALAAESLLYLAVLPVPSSTAGSAAALLAQTLALAATALVSALIVRQRSGGGR